MANTKNDASNNCFLGRSIYHKGACAMFGGSLDILFVFLRGWPYVEATDKEKKNQTISASN